MIRQVTTERLPIKMWLGEVEPGAWQQARNLANFPFAVHHVALMADCHQGFGMPIGGVLATRQVVVPNAVGVDIGCGMAAVRTALTGLKQATLRQVLSRIRATVPLGFKHHRQPRSRDHMPEGYDVAELPVVRREYDHALHQLGTLGGGNHFIEVQKDPDQRLWLMVHSGSRNLGKQVADHYNRLAVRLNQQWASPVPKSMQLAYLPVDSPEGQRYWREMNYCLDFAFANRRLLMDAALAALDSCITTDLNPEPMINIAHNYAAQETHFRQKVIVHRKGATKAGPDTIGIIPGSQGANSYIVRGRGNPDSFASCSHGAGRIMGRKQAIRSLDLADEQRKLDKQGVLHSLHDRRDLDEAAGAYKEITEVMRQQSDLVEVLTELRPLAVIKG